MGSSEGQERRKMAGLSWTFLFPTRKWDHMRVRRRGKTRKDRKVGVKMDGWINWEKGIQVE